MRRFLLVMRLIVFVHLVVSVEYSKHFFLSVQLSFLHKKKKNRFLFLVCRGSLVEMGWNRVDVRQVLPFLSLLYGCIVVLHSGIWAAARKERRGFASGGPFVFFSRLIWLASSFVSFSFCLKPRTMEAPCTSSRFYSHCLLFPPPLSASDQKQFLRSCFPLRIQEKDVFLHCFPC